MSLDRPSFYDPELSNLVQQLNRVEGGPGRVPPLDWEPPRPLLPDESVEVAGAERLIELLTLAARRGAADLLLVPGVAAVFRVDGELLRYGAPLAAEEVRELLLSPLDARARQRLAAARFVDFAFGIEGVSRFRANVHHQRGLLAGCFRVLPQSVPVLADLGLPAVVARLSELRTGLVLVVGPAGSGKTTTLAALLGQVLSQRAVHAITIEEPVEYLHTSANSVVEQIEIPVDCPSFAVALRSALRQSPDVLVVGEMRDADTVAAALTAAETGHLVLASIHAFTAPQAVNRVIDAFPPLQQEQVRRQLATTVSAILAQRLIPAKKTGRRVAVMEVLLATDAVRNLIRENRIHNLGQALANGKTDGMVTLEGALAALVRDGRIAREVAERHAYHPEELRRLL